MNLSGWIAVALLTWFPVAFVWVAARAGRPDRDQDRCRLLTSMAAAVIGLAAGRALVPWDLVSPALWALAAAITTGGVITAARAWPQLPAVAGSRPRLRLVITGLDLAISTALVVVLS